MSKIVSILHISDIHKPNGMTLNRLYDSLVRDKERWEEEGIERLDYIVLSGDVVQGGKTLEAIVDQYKEAESFLEKLCNVFLLGERKRMIIVPGNHDVCWPQSRKCMREIDVNSNIDQYRKHREEDGLRWDWDNLKLFKIESEANYTRRFDLFVQFYNHFFKGIRNFPEHPEHEALCIPFDNDSICFACFNSCHQNDHLNEMGNIPKDAIFSIEDDLREYYNQGMLPIGVWHHNAYGDPYQTNYMSKYVLSTLIEHRIKIGLFGHQHMSQIAEEYSDLLISGNNNNRLLLIGSGTLFGGDKEQHKAVRRQFNIITLEMKRGEANVHIRVREDANFDTSSDDPYWRNKSLPNGDIKYQVRFKKISDDEILRRIDDKTRRTHDYKSGIESLRSSGLNTEDISRMEDEYLKELDNRALLVLLPEPKKYDHCYLLMSAIDYEHDAVAFERLKNSKVLQESLKIDKLLREDFMKLNEKFK